MKNKFVGLGMEAIDHQVDNSLRSELTLFIRRLNGVSSQADIDGILTAIEVVVFKRLKMTIKIIVGEDLGDMMARPPLLTRSSPLIGKLGRKFAGSDEFFNYAEPFDKIVSGGVDRKKSILTGDFCEMETVVLIPRAMVRGEYMEPEEWAGLLAHELGHAFNYFELLGFGVATNMVLNEAARTWDRSYSKETRINVLNAVEKTFSQKIVDKDAIASNDDFSVAEATITNTAMCAIRSELGVKTFDDRLCESLADQFAARHGFARDLVTGIDKYHRAAPWLSRDAAYRTTTSMIIANVIKGVALATANMPTSVALRAMQGVKIVSTSMIGAGQTASIVVFGSLLSTLVSAVHPTKYRYDKPDARNEAIRREVISALKNPNVDKKRAAQLLDDLSVIDDVQASLNKLGMLDKMLFDFIAESALGIRKEFRVQQEYEKLANNELFVRAAKLSTLDKV